MVGFAVEDRALASDIAAASLVSFSPAQRRLLLLTAATSSAAGLAAELLLGTLASYLVGSQALAYGVAVGGFLAAMGLGAYLSQFIATRGDRSRQRQQLLNALFAVELGIAPLTALLPLGLFALFVANSSLWLGLAFATTLLGTLAGMEIPLITRLIEQDRELRGALAGVLALDYAGALAGSLLLPLVLLPLVGLFPAAALIGSLPALMAFFLGRAFPRQRRWQYLGLAIGLGAIALAPVTLWVSNRLEDNLYQAPIVRREQSAYQRIVLTRRGRDVRLFLDGNLQLSTLDEYRYHEALVHPAMSAVMAAGRSPQQVLLLGAGDGMALREILKWPEVQRVILLELDPSVVDLAQQYGGLRSANQGVLDDPRVTVRYGDAFRMVPELSDRFDVIIADFPDPDRPTLAKLYAKGFYQQLKARLQPGGVFVTQASSPFFAPQVFSCIGATLEAVGLQPHPYTVTVPSFGPWGFVLGMQDRLEPRNLQLPVSTRFLTEALLAGLFELPADMAAGPVRINRLGDPVIVRYQNDPQWSFYH